MIEAIRHAMAVAIEAFNALAGAVGEHLRLLRYLGAAYLVYTGVGMWRAPVAVASRRVRGGLVRLFGIGFLLNVSNPKMPIFYFALLPGVLGVRPLSLAGTATLLAIILAVEALVVGAHVLVAVRAKAALSEPRRVRALNRGAGALMIGAGALVASR